MQRKLYRLDKKRQRITGIFHLKDDKGKNVRVVRQILATFEEVGYGADGNPIKPGEREEARIDNWCWSRWETINKALLLEEKVKTDQAEMISTHMERWIQLSAGSKKDGTIALYELMRDQYLEAAEDHLLFDKDERTHLRRYSLRHAEKFVLWMKDRGLARATIHQRLRSLRRFLHWLAEPGREEIDVVPSFKDITPPKQKKVVKALDDSQIAQLFRIIADRQASATFPKQAWFSHLHERYLVVAVGTGRRLGEIYSRKWADINLNRGMMFVGNQDDVNFEVKDREENWINLPATVTDYLLDLRSRFPKEVWLLDDGKGALALKPLSISSAFGRLITDPPYNPEYPNRTGGLGLKGQGFKPTHNFRAGYITQLFRDGIDLETVRRSVGHSDLETTMGYLVEPDALLKKAVKTYDKRMSKLVGRKHLRLVDGGGQG